MTQATWYNSERVSQPGSVVLNRWRAEREAQRARGKVVQAADSGTYFLGDGGYDSELYRWMTGGINAAGVAVNERTAMCVSAVHACIGLIGGAIASMPMHIFQRGPEGRQRVNDNNVWWLFNERAHENWTSASFWEFSCQSRLLHGDAFAIIHRNRRSDITGFEPLHPDMVDVRKHEGQLVYVIHDGIAKPKTLQSPGILHFRGTGFNGTRSISVLRHALNNSAGTALAADEYSARFFSNGARPDIALTTDQKLTQEQIDTLRNAWDQRHAGSRRAHRPAVLQGGLKVEQLTMSAEDAQLISTRRFQVEDICRIFGVPPFMVGHNEKTTSWGSGIEQLSIGFVKYTLQSHLTQIEQEINAKVWPRSLKYFSEFQTAGLERGDLKSRYESHRIAIGRAGEPGFMTVNEARRLENLPPIDGGDILNNGNQKNDANVKAS